MGDNFLSVEIEFESITALNNNMKPPKLPGTEKFKFSDRKYSDCRKGSTSCEVNNNSNNSSNFVRGIPSRSTCPTTTSLSISKTEPTLNRYDSKRKPILPISSRMTSRVLTLTHLPLDSFDIRDLSSCRKPSNYCNNYVTAEKSRDLRAPTVTSAASRVSLFSDCSGSHCSSSQPSPRSLCSPLDRSHTPSHWAKSAHRLSTSSQSSWEDIPDSSHETLWLSRK